PGVAGCFDLTSDNQNCGTCGAQCLPPVAGTVQGTATCVQSQCVFTCPTDAGVVDGGGPIVQCNADSGTPGCFDLTQSNDSCGSCGTACPGSQSCTQSQCCPTGDNYCGGKCTSVQTDPLNCGACDAGCPSPAQCSAGVCSGYTTSNPTVAFIDACTLTNAATTLVNKTGWAYTPAAITLPIPFSFYGTAVTQFWLGSQGTLGIGAPKGGFNMPDGYPACGGAGDQTTAYPAIVAFGDEELSTGPQGVCYGTQGTAPNQQFVATWKQATEEGDPSSLLTFSIVLTQTTNTVDLMYQTLSGADGGIDPTVAGANATVGMQNLPVYTAVSCDVTFVKTTPYVIRLTPVQ
ncbi:MAG: hypothetical protein ABSE49_33665, partial [Polyangiaceae bacterium]